MNMVEIKRYTHLVLKYDDIDTYLSKRQQKKLRKLEEVIRSGRYAMGKKINNEYYVCNEDEPYASKVMVTILEGEMEKGGI
jgi:hypothetical protein